MYLPEDRNQKYFLPQCPDDKAGQTNVTNSKTKFSKTFFKKSK
jgi:hypothetical protein